MKFFTNARLIFSSLSLIGLVMGLQACGGGGGGTTPPPVVNTSLASTERGYYEGFVTLNVAVGGDLTINPGEFQAIFDEKKFVVIYKGSQILLYKGTFTEVTATTFKADLRIYRAGNFIATAAITNGTINLGVLKGTITGTGAYINDDYASSAVDMELTYDSVNSLTPPDYLTGASNVWQDATPTGAVKFNTTTNIDFLMSINNVPAELNCLASTFETSDVINERTGRIRKFLTSALSGCGGIDPIDGQQINGYFTNYNGGVNPNDRMLIVVSDNNYAYVGILPCASGTCFSPP